MADFLSAQWPVGVVRVQPGFIYTSHVDYRGKGRVDCTRRGRSPFGPSWLILIPQLRKREQGKVTPEAAKEYKAKYLAEMSALWERDTKPWVELWTLAERVGAVLVCHCTDAQRCHRTYLRAFALELASKAPQRTGLVALSDGGEISPRSEAWLH